MALDPAGVRTERGTRTGILPGAGRWLDETRLSGSLDSGGSTTTAALGNRTRRRLLAGAGRFLQTRIFPSSVPAVPVCPNPFPAELAQPVGLLSLDLRAAGLNFGVLRRPACRAKLAMFNVDACPPKTRRH